MHEPTAEAHLDVALLGRYFFSGSCSSEEIAAFYKGYGADPKAFIAAMDSPATTLLLERSNDFAVASGIEGTPSIVVNGKYRVTARSMEDTLRVTDYLVAKERARK